MASRKKIPAARPGADSATLPPPAATFAAYYERTRLYLRRFLAYIKPGEARNQPAGGTVGGARPPAEAVSMDSHVVRLLVGSGYGAERAAALAGLSRGLEGELTDAPESAGGPWLLAHEGPDPAERFAELQQRLGLSMREVDLLWLLLVPEMIPEMLWLYRTIWGDASQVACQEDFLIHVLDPFGACPGEVRRILRPQGKLLGLLLVEEVDVRPNRGERYFRANRRLVEHLLGLDAVDGSLNGICEVLDAALPLERSTLEAGVARSLAMELSARLSSMAWANLDGAAAPFVIHLHGPAEVGKRTICAGLAASVGRSLLRVDGVAWLAAAEPHALLRRIRCEAFLRKALVLFDDADLLGEGRHTPQLQDLAHFIRSHAEPVFVAAGSQILQLGDLVDDLLPFEVKTPPSERREEIWRLAIGELPLAPAADVDARDLARKYNLPPGKIRKAARQAVALAGLRGEHEQLRQRDLVQATTALLVHHLGTVADRVEKTLDWEDLILPEDCLRTLKEIVRRYRHQAQVMDEWGFRSKFVYGIGISVLFSGPPGTGKTMTAGILARELDMELFRIDLSRVVSKWIGETEKNLARVFDEGKASQAIILFDEADSLFGRRGEVRSSVDRYSNLEVNYLLQRMETYEGISILTTNQSQSMDEAFMRRITFKVPFPFPDESTRERLWRSMIPSAAWVSKAVNFRQLADKFEFSGGHIKNAILRAAFLAAEDKQPISQRLLVTAAIDEARSLGRLLRVEDLLDELAEEEEQQRRGAQRDGKRKEKKRPAISR